MQIAHRYTRILQLNYKELGYVLKAIDPLEVSGTLLSEGHDRITNMDFAVVTYRNLIKTIQRKLRLKINVIYWRKSMNQCAAMIENLAKAFPTIQFINH